MTKLFKNLTNDLTNIEQKIKELNGNMSDLYDGVCIDNGLSKLGQTDRMTLVRNSDISKNLLRQAYTLIENIREIILTSEYLLDSSTYKPNNKDGDAGHFKF